MSWLRIYRVALAVLPRRVREKHGSEMEGLFARALDRARPHGRTSVTLTGVACVWDVIRRGLYERVRAALRGSALERAREHGRGGRWSMEALREDFVYSIRSLIRTPTFTVVAVVSLALGIGANTAIFSVVDAVLLRPLPFADPDRVVQLAWEADRYVQPYLTPVRFEYWRSHARTFEAVATWQSPSARVGGGDEVSRVRMLRVSSGFLRVLGYAPALGREFSDTEHVAGGPRVALISHGMWEDRFGGTADVVGRTLRLDEEPYMVVGVLPEAFAFPYVDEDIGVVVPLALAMDPDDAGENWPAIARLRDGVSHAEALADVVSLRSSFRAGYPHQVYAGEHGMTLSTFAELHVAGGRRPLWILMGAVAFVLLIVCANVANLFLARAARRRGEIALRVALGATRPRIMRLVLAESALVSAAGAALGLCLARWGVDTLLALTPQELPRMADVGIDGRVVVFTLAIAVATGLAFGSAAAWPAARNALSDTLKESARAHSGHTRARQGLLIAQAALSTILLFGAGLLVMTLIGLKRVDGGFDVEGLTAVRIPFKPTGYESSRDVWTFEQRVTEAARGVPGIVSIAGATNLPLERGINFPMSIGGRPDDWGSVEWRGVTPGYFETLGIPVTAGRSFDVTDVEGGPPVAIVNEAFGRRYFPGESPIGQRIDVGRIRGEYLDPSLEGTGAEIVGVVADIHEVSLRAEPRRTMYVPQSQAPTRISDVLGTMPVFIVRASPAAGALEGTLTEVMRAVDPGLPAPDVFPLHDVLAASLARERFGATLLGSFAALALALTAFGIYGVLAYAVRQRRQEIGIRMALGAAGRDVARLVLTHGLAPVAVGLALGVAGSLGLSRVIEGYLWGVAPTDPRALAAVAAMLLAVGVLASWIPAREAARLDPMETLRRE